MSQRSSFLRHLGALSWALIALANPSAGRAQTVTVCIDPGHGGDDPGAVANDLNEDEVNLTAALAFRDWLMLDTSDDSGGGSFEVLMTRETDVAISLAGRCDFANSEGADYFMSIHSNAGGGDGTETYAYASGTEADDLAHRAQEELVDHLGTRDRGVKHSGFYVLVHTVMPADLAELAFLDTWEGNAEILSDPAMLGLAGLAHLHAIQRHVGLAEHTPSGGPGLDEPTASLTIASVPDQVEAGGEAPVVVSYETNLSELDLTGHLVGQMKDAESWDIIDEQTWDNDGAGIQGPASDHELAFSAPDRAGAVFFVVYLALRDQGWDDRLADDSSLASPTQIVDTGHSEPGPEPDPDGGPSADADVEPVTRVEILRVPSRIQRGASFMVEVGFSIVESDHRGPFRLSLDMVEASTSQVVETQERGGEGGLEVAEGMARFELQYAGPDSAVWFVACLRDLSQPEGSTCELSHSTATVPTPVSSLQTSRPEDGGCDGGCGQATTDRAPWRGTWPWLVVLLMVVALRQARKLKSPATNSSRQGAP